MIQARFPRGVELVTGVFIFGADGRVALARSPKWTTTLIPPGGHVEPGESLSDAAVREAYEETGLRCQYVGVLNVGEYMSGGSGGYHREAHMVFAHVLLETQDTHLIPQPSELSMLEWMDPTADDVMKQVGVVCGESLSKAVRFRAGKDSLIEFKRLSGDE